MLCTWEAGKVTAGLVESNGSLPPGGWLTVTWGWLPVHQDQLRAQCLLTSMGSLYLFYHILKYRFSSESQCMCLCQIWRWLVKPYLRFRDFLIFQNGGNICDWQLILDFQNFEILSADIDMVQRVSVLFHVKFRVLVSQMAFWRSSVTSFWHLTMETWQCCLFWTCLQRLTL